LLFVVVTTKQQRASPPAFVVLGAVIFVSTMFLSTRCQERFV
jgi:hypothetical protein